MEDLTVAYKGIPHILVVDDELDLCEVICSSLQSLGAKTVAAYSAEDALHHLQSQDFSLVICDIRMKGSSGLDLLTRCHMRGIFVPFVFVTGDDSSEIIMRAVRLGAIDFILKPIDFDEMAIVLERVLGIARRKEDIRKLIHEGLSGKEQDKLDTIKDLTRQIAMIRQLLANKRAN